MHCLQYSFLFREYACYWHERKGNINVASDCRRDIWNHRWYGNGRRRNSDSGTYLVFGSGSTGSAGDESVVFSAHVCFALAAHIKKKQVNIPLALILAGSGLAGSLCGAYLASVLESKLLGRLFGGFLIGARLVEKLQVIL